MPLSYRMERGPGIKDGFTREKRSRVSLHLVVMQRRGEERRGGSCRGQEWLEGRKGSGRRREGGLGREKRGEGNDGGKERLQREGERGGSSYNAPLVHCPEEVRKKARERNSGIEQEKRRIYCPLARSNLSLSLSYTSLLLRNSLRSLRPRCTLRRDKKRETEKEKGQQKEEVRREERAVGEVREGTEGRKTCPNLHDPVQSLPIILTITKLKTTREDFSV